MFESQLKNSSAYITALIVYSPGQLHLRRISQGGVLGLALIVTLLVVDLWVRRQELKFH